MKNYVQAGFVLTIPAPAKVTGGEVVVVGEIVGIAAGDAANGAPCDVAVVGVFDVAKVGADVLAVGDPVYVTAAGLATADAQDGSSADNVRLGVAVEAAGNGAASARVRLN